MNYTNFTINSLVAANGGQQPSKISSRHCQQLAAAASKCPAMSTAELRALAAPPPRPPSFPPLNQNGSSQAQSAHCYPSQLASLARGAQTSWPSPVQAAAAAAAAATVFAAPLGQPAKGLPAVYFESARPQLNLSAGQHLSAGRPAPLTSNPFAPIQHQQQFACSVGATIRDDAECRPAPELRPSGHEMDLSLASSPPPLCPKGPGRPAGQRFARGTAQVAGGGQRSERVEAEDENEVEDENNNDNKNDDDDDDDDDDDEQQQGRRRTRKTKIPKTVSRVE